MWPGARPTSMRSDILIHPPFDRNRHGSKNCGISWPLSVIMHTGTLHCYVGQLRHIAKKQSSAINIHHI